VLMVITAVTNSDSPAGRAAACIDAANEYVPGARTPLGMDHRHDVFTSCDRPQAKPVYVEHVHWMVTPPWQLPVLCSQLAASSSGSREEHASRMTVSLMLTVRFPPARIGCKRARRRVTSISAEPHCPFIQPKARNRYNTLTDRRAPDSRSSRPALALWLSSCAEVLPGVASDQRKLTRVPLPAVPMQDGTMALASTTMFADAGMDRNGGPSMTTVGAGRAARDTTRWTASDCTPVSERTTRTNSKRKPPSRAAEPSVSIGTLPASASAAAISM
jgi:hypothetical protein